MSVEVGVSPRVGFAPIPLPCMDWSCATNMSLAGPLSSGGDGVGQLVYGRGSKHGEHYIFKLSLEESLRWNSSYGDTSQRVALRSLYCAMVSLQAKRLGCTEYTIITHTRRALTEGVVT